MKKVCLLLAILIVVSCFTACGGQKTSQKIVFEELILEMKELYPYADSRWPEDDSYMKLLWNPNGGGLERAQMLEDTIEGIKYVNKRLGFSEDLFDKMAETTEAMGTQTEKNSNYVVTWSFNSSRGLEVKYSRK